MMVSDKAFVFLLHRSVADPDLSQLDRLEKKVDRLVIAVEKVSGRIALLLQSLAEEDSDGQLSLTLDGDPAGQERDATKSLG